MSNRKAWVWIVASGAIALCGFRLAAFEQGEAKGRDGQLPGLMLAKLANTQRVVAGLVAKDFGEIRRGAEDMLRVCDAEQWGTNADPIYTQHRSELRRQAFKLSELADTHNLDGAAFCYIQTVSTCISCHEHCRDVLRIAQIPNSGSGVISIPTSEQEALLRGMPTYRR